MSCTFTSNKRSAAWRVLSIIALIILYFPLKLSAENSYPVAVLNLQGELVFSYATESEIKTVRQAVDTESGMNLWLAQSTKLNGNTVYYFDIENSWISDEYALSVKKVIFNSSFASTRWGQLFYWFEGLKNLTEIQNIKYLNTKGVTNMMYMFKDCQSLNSLDLSTFDTSSVVNMGGMFSGCTALSSLNLSSFDTSNVTEMSYMFSQCENLTSLDLSSFNTSKVTDMKQMFSGCKKITSLDLHAFNTDNVTNMRAMFYLCIKLKELDLSDFSTSSTTDVNMDNMFASCISLQTIYCDKKWNAGSSADMFKYCYKLSGAIGFDESKTDVAYANPTNGYFTAGLPAAMLRDNTLYLSLLPMKYIRAYANQTLYPFWYGDVITNWDLKADRWNNNHNADIKKVVIEASFKDAKVKHLKSFFYQLYNMTEITGLQYINSKNVNSIQAMFMGCRSLKNVSLEGLNTSNVTDMGTLFSGCLVLQTVNLPDSFVTNKVKDVSYMFADCEGITELNLNRQDMSGVTDMACMFINCQNLKTIFCDNTWSCLNSTNMFCGCDRLAGMEWFDPEKTDVSMANPQAYFTTTTVENYNLWICGQQVSNHIAVDLSQIPGVQLEEGGYLRYVIKSNTLEMKGARIMGSNVPAVRTNMPNLTIKIARGGESRLIGFGEAALSLEDKTTITGDRLWIQGHAGTTSGSIALAVFMGARRASLTIHDGTVEAEGQYAVAGKQIQETTERGTVETVFYGTITVEGMSYLHCQGSIYNLGPIRKITLGDDVRITTPDGAAFKWPYVCVDNTPSAKGDGVVIQNLALSLKKGDVNQDGNVDISDIVAIINQIAGTASYSYSDVNNDGKTDISDIVAVINIIAQGEAGNP